MRDPREKFHDVASKLEMAQDETKKKKKVKAKLDQKLKKESKELQIKRGESVNLKPQATQLRIDIDHSETKLAGLEDQQKSNSSDLEKVKNQIKKLKVEMKAAKTDRENFEREIADSHSNVSLCMFCFIDRISRFFHMAPIHA